MKNTIFAALVTMFTLSAAHAAIWDATCRDARGSFDAEIIFRPTSRGAGIGARAVRDYNRGLAVTVPRLSRRGNGLTGVDAVASSALGTKRELVEITPTTVKVSSVSRGAAFGNYNLSVDCRLGVRKNADDFREVMREVNR